MKKFLSVAFIILCYSSFSLTAQTKAGDPPPISFKGKITFERKNNVHKQMEEMMKNLTPEQRAQMEQMAKA